jgi:hypothetical protein
MKHLDITWPDLGHSQAAESTPSLRERPPSSPRGVRITVLARQPLGEISPAEYGCIRTLLEMLRSLLRHAPVFAAE